MSDSTPKHPRYMAMSPSSLWHAVMRDCELRFVQRLYTMKHQKEYVNEKLVQLVDVPICAAMHSRLDVLLWLDAQRTPSSKPWSPMLLSYAMLAKNYDMAKWLLAHRPESCGECFMSSLIEAVSARDLELFEMVITFRPDAFIPQVMDYAAACGNMETLKYLHERGYSCTTRAIEGAARNGHMEIVQFLLTQRSEGCTPEAMNAAAEGGDFEMVRFFHEQRTEGCTARAMDNAASCGHLDVVRFLHENRSEGCSVYAMNEAARNGHFEVIKYLHTHRTEGCSGSALVEAAKQGHFDILKFVYENYNVAIEQADGLISTTFHNGHLDAAHYLRDVVRIPFSQSELNLAVSNGDLELVKLLHEGRHERSSELALRLASATGNTAMIDYLLEHRDEPLSQNFINCEAEGNRLIFIERLHKRFGSKVTVTCMPCLLSWGYFEMVRYVHEAMEVPFPDDAIEYAAFKGNFELVQYVIKKLGDESFAKAMQRAEQRGQHTVVELLEGLNRK